VTNLPAVAQVLSRRRLAEYEGRYVAEEIQFDGTVKETVFELQGDSGQLRVTGGPTRLAFYRKDYVLLLDHAGRPTGTRADFVRDAHGRVRWLRSGGRLYHHGR
jgi:hypothetical protein